MTVTARMNELAQGEPGRRPRRRYAAEFQSPAAQRDPSAARVLARRPQRHGRVFILTALFAALALIAAALRVTSTGPETPVEGAGVVAEPGLPNSLEHSPAPGPVAVTGGWRSGTAPSLRLLTPI